MKKALLNGLAAACLIGLAPLASVQADSYPSKPVRIIAGFPPGGSTDILARLVAEGLAEKFKQPFIVENRPGGNSIIATDIVARAPADGYTFLVVGSSAMTINPELYPDLPYSPQEDFTPVTILGDFPLILAVRPELGINTVQELIDLSKQPDRSLDYAAPSVAFQLACATKRPVA